MDRQKPRRPRLPQPGIVDQAAGAREFTLRTSPRRAVSRCQEERYVTRRTPEVFGFWSQPESRPRPSNVSGIRRSVTPRRHRTRRITISLLKSAGPRDRSRLDCVAVGKYV